MMTSPPAEQFQSRLEEEPADLLLFVRSLPNMSRANQRVKTDGGNEVKLTLQKKTKTKQQKDSQQIQYGGMDPLVFSSL